MSRAAFAIAASLLLPLPALAQERPSCALTGSMSVMIDGKPALRLSDVANCPPDLYEVINSIMIEGQPMVHFRSGISGKTTCAARGDKSVTVEGKEAQTLGDVDCSSQ